MEKESDSWFPYQQFELPPSYSNISGSSVLRGQLPALMSPYTKGVCANGAIPMAPYSCLPLSEARQPIEQYNWFFGTPRFRQTFASPLVKEKLASDQIDNYGVNGNGKQFLVFDKSGDQTSLIYSSGIRTPINCLTSWNLEPCTSVGVIKEELLRKEVANPKVSSFQNLDGYSQEYPEDVMKNQSFDGIQCISPGMIAPEGVIEDEMHEDTEELNALLYSDDENDYSEDEDDDDVTSTGHSPNTMIDHVIHHLEVDEDEDEDEEVASSACSFKRYKLLDGAYDVPPLVHVSAIKKKPVKSYDLDNDAESYCSNFDNQVSVDSSVSGRKRSRSENIRTKLSILQNIIPGAKGKTPTVVIDEAVQYLKFLKDKAKSFGLDSP